MKKFLTFFLFLVLTINVVLAESHYVKVDDRQYAILQEGSKKPTLLFFNGAGKSFTTWNKVIAALPKKQAIFAYNRAGVAGSTPLIDQITPRTAKGVITRLRTLLKVSKVNAPYILVAHSIGSLYALYFARAYPNEVRGLVLIEPNVDAMLALNKLKNLTEKQQAVLTKLIQQVNYNLLNEKRRFVEYRSAIKHIPTAKESLQISLYLESLGRIKSQQEIDALAPLKNIPVIVLVDNSGSSQYDKMKRLAAKEITQSVTSGKYEEIKETDHYVQQDAPKVVTTAIKTIL